MLAQLRESIASLPDDRSRALLCLGVGASVSSLLAFQSVLFQDGWPANHEAVSFAYRTHVYVEALRHGDLLPLWIGDAHYGFGSPMPLFYHKTFNWVSALISFVMPSMKAAICTALLCFSLVGVFGIRRLVGALGLGGWPALLLALSFPHLNYAMTDWLVRGAMAEYAALCLIPWLLAWCLRAVRTRRFGFGIAPLLIGLFFTHNLLAYYAVGVVGVAFAIVLAGRRNAWPELVRNALVAAAVFFAVAGPFITLIAIVGPITDLGYFNKFHPPDQYVGFSRYFFDREYEWGLVNTDLTVQLDLLYLLGIVVAALFVALGRRRKFAALEGERWSLGYLGTLLVIFLFLQLPISSCFYESFPGAAMIQFPWRLLAFLTVVVVALFALLLAHLDSSHPGAAAALALAVVLGTIAINLARDVAANRVPQRILEAPPDLMWPEYFPLWTTEDGERPNKLRSKIKAMALGGAVAIEGASCRFEDRVETGYLERVYPIDCAGPARIALPLAYSGIEEVGIEDAARLVRLVVERTEHDPRMRVVVPAGPQRIRVRLPTLMRAWTRSFAPAFEAPAMASGKQRTAVD